LQELIVHVTRSSGLALQRTDVGSIPATGEIKREKIELIDPVHFTGLFTWMLCKGGFK